MRITFALLASLGLLALAAPVGAAGLPQLDSESYAPQIVWLAITFAVLYLLMSRVALPRISQVLEERQDRIDDNLEKAANLKAEADAAARTYEQSLAVARGQAAEIVRETSQRLTAAAAARHAEVSERLAAEIDAAESRIAAAREDALADVRQATAELVRQAAGRLLGEAPESGAVDAAVAATLKERG